jgi:hypothetical protein
MIKPLQPVQIVKIPGDRALFPVDFKRVERLMKANPIVLRGEELTEALQAACK